MVGLNTNARQPFQYEAEMQIKSINSSGLLAQHYEKISHLYRPRVGQGSVERKRTQSQQRVNSAKPQNLI